jgi:hypothetical protein
MKLINLITQPRVMTGETPTPAANGSGPGGNARR